MDTLLQTAIEAAHRAGELLLRKLPLTRQVLAQSGLSLNELPGLWVACIWTPFDTRQSHPLYFARSLNCCNRIQHIA